MSIDQWQLQCLKPKLFNSHISRCGVDDYPVNPIIIALPAFEILFYDLNCVILRQLGQGWNCFVHWRQHNHDPTLPRPTVVAKFTGLCEGILETLGSPQ